MDANGIDWRIHTHAQTPHGFALAPGRILRTNAYFFLQDSWRVISCTQYATNPNQGIRTCCKKVTQVIF